MNARRGRLAAAIGALGLAIAGLSLSGAAFVASSSNPHNTISSASDFTAPSVTASTVATTSSGAPIGAGGAVKQGGTYRVYANISDSGNPASGFSAATADVSSISGSGSSSVALAACTSNCTVGAVTYAYASAEKTASNPLTAGSSSYSITATDNAANRGTTSFGVTVDNSAPTLSSLQMLDTNHNGKVDQVQATFNETLATSTATSPWTLTSAPSGATLSSVATSGSVATLTLNEGSGSADTSVGSFKVALASASSGIRDIAGNQASFASQAPSDGAEPEVVSINRSSTSPTNASNVQFAVTFSEPVTGVGTSDFSTAATGPTGTSVASVSGTGSSYTVTAATGSGDGTLGVNLVDDDSIVDASSNKLGGTGGGNGDFTGQTYTIDKTPPQLSSLQMFDTNHNGKVDQIQAAFNETLATSTSTAPWTLANVPSGGSLSAVSTSGSVATLTLSEGSGAADTSVGTFTVALATSATGIRDTLGNQASFSATAPADKAGPIPTALTDTNGSVDGKFEQGDTMTATFSEPVKGVGTSSNVVLTGGSGNGAGANDSLTAPGLLQLSSLGSPDYISTNGSVANFNSSTLSQPASNQVKLTLGACSGSCSLLTQSAAAAMTFTPDTSLTDAAGNSAAGSPTFTIRLF